MKTTYSVISLMLLFLAAFDNPSLPAGAPEGAWTKAQDGLFYRMQVWKSTDGESVKILGVRLSSKQKWRLKVVDVFGEFRKKPHATYSIYEIVEDLPVRFVINGGYSQSFSRPQPAGLLRIAGDTIHRLNGASSVQTGIFCVGADGTISILMRHDSNANQCRDALQAGPIVVEPNGVIGIHPSERKSRQRYSRSVVGIDGNGDIVFVATEAMHLYDLASLLVSETSKSGFDMVVALNLSGDADTGMFLKGNGRTVSHGRIDTPISTAIALFSR